MDSCWRRLRLELLFVKEAGDDLHARMNFMMGALQELKLLQVQTALEQLEISGKKNCVAPPAAESIKPQDQQHQLSRNSGQEDRVNFNDLHGNSVRTSSSTFRLEDESIPLARKVSGYTTPPVEYCGPRMCQTLTDHQSMHPSSSGVTPADLTGILHSLSREGPSLDSDYTEDSLDDTDDWTSSLMSCSRNRQPLVLGDNVLADLVGNWLDLPELDKDCGEEGREINRPDSPAHSVSLSRSEELCKRFSLTSNIFRKFLRTVRPDRDKLLKEKPGWMSPGQDFDAELFKRPKKNGKTKGRFYLPFWAGGRPQAPNQPQQVTTGEGTNQVLGLYLDQKTTDTLGKVQPLLDYNAAVWV